MKQPKPTKRFIHLRRIALLCIFAAVSLGVNSCTEPSEYCKSYPAKADRTACTSYCADTLGVDAHADQAELVRSCQFGQLQYLANYEAGAAESLSGCDRRYADNLGFSEACRSGVAAEVLRVAHSRKTPGTSSDGTRENGNGK